MSLPSYLSEDQASALKTIMEHIENNKESILVGPAGSGKSTLTKEIISLAGRPVVLAAPTGKAAIVLRDKTGQDAATLHRRLYRGACADKKTGRLEFRSSIAPCSEGDLLIIDEGSMVGRRIYDDLMAAMPRTAKLLWIADREQLPPINETWGPSLEFPTAALTQVHRQAQDSPIIQYATEIRQGRGVAWRQKYENQHDDLQIYDGVQSAIDWLVDARMHFDDATLLTYTNATRQEVNHRVREELHLGDAENAIVVGDKLVCRSNNYAAQLMNGEVVTVCDVVKGTFQGETRYLVEFEELPDMQVFILESHVEMSSTEFQTWRNSSVLLKEEKDQYLHVHYGQCLTVHSSQGSQWDRVGFISDPHCRRMTRTDPENSRRFFYTAVTRAAKSLAIFEV